MRPVLRGPVPQRTTRSGTLQKLLPEEYGMFMFHLAGVLGEYCSYCEVPLGASLAIEHVLPKSKYPDAETDWSNFLLSCPNCNSTKGTRNASRDGYIWPDTAPTFDLLTYYRDTDGLVKVRANPSGTYGQGPINATIALVGLNANGLLDPKQSDRRMAHRTLVWARAERLAAGLSRYYTDRYTPATIGNAQGDLDIYMLKRLISTTAVASGFWSVWMTTFAAADFVTDQTRKELLRELFVAPFPGTDASRIRLIN